MKLAGKQHYFLSWLFLLLLAGWSSTALATVSISATVDKTHLTVDDTLTLSVKVNGVQNSSPPTLPPLPDFDVESRGTSSSIQVINGNMQSSVTFRYLLLPKKEGRFKIGAIRLERDGKKYESPPIVVYISDSSESLPDSDKELFVEALVSNTSPYLQEQIALTYRLYRKVEVRNLSLDAPLEHFRKVAVGEPTETDKVINGVRYYISEINYALFPMQAGVLKIPSAIFEMDVVRRNTGGRGSFNRRHFPGSIFDDPFFSGGATLQRKVLRTKPIEITVLPLPEKNRPETFSNLVGTVTLDSTIKPRTLVAGDTATWTVTLKGRGNMGEATLEAPENAKQFKIYKDQPVSDERAVNGFIEGSKTFTFALVPIQAGSLTIPKVQVDYWDPEEKAYRSVSTEPESLTVTPGQKTNLTTSGPDKNTAAHLPGRTAPDILPIHTRPELFQEPGSIYEKTGFWIVVFVLPMVGFLIFKVTYAKRFRMKHDTVFARKQNAYPKAIKRLQNLKQGHEGTGKNHAGDVSMIFREYLGDRFEFQGTALTPDEVEGRLRNGTIEENHINATRDLLNKCEAAEFAPAGHASANDLVDESLHLLNHLEKGKE